MSFKPAAEPHVLPTAAEARAGDLPTPSHMWHGLPTTVRLLPCHIVELAGAKPVATHATNAA